MSLISLSYILFLFAVLVLYYALPHRFQWIVLLAASCAFYLSFGPQYIVFILVASAAVYCATRYMDSQSAAQKAELAASPDLTREEKKAVKARYENKRKRALVLTLCLNVGMLVVFKYTPFLTQQISSLVSVFSFSSVQLPVVKSIVAPIGISFYTFQTTGYLVDVYWKKYKSEKNFFRFFLFASFFPQIVQGPINQFDRLAEQLYAQHSFDYHRFSYGCQRMIWGFLKKLVVADRISPYLQDIFAGYAEKPGLMLLVGAFMYSVQIYADFSGYMDIVCGFCEILGIDMAENFERPYFSKSVAEYWRRWHITLGAWFKTYLYYPIALSHFAQNAGKRSKKRFGSHIGKNTPAVISLVVVWFTTGLWHGASWAYIVWGGLNGFFIIFSMLFEPLYDKTKTALKIRESSRLWQAFQTLRTFVLITFIKVFPEIGTLSDGVGYFRSMVANLSIPHSPWDALPAPMANLDYPVLLGMIACMFLVSMIQRKQSVRDFLHARPVVIRWGIYIAALLCLILFGGSVQTLGGGFMYAQF